MSGHDSIVALIIPNYSIMNNSGSGTSLKASGWHLEKEYVGGGTWDNPSRRRVMIEGQLNLFEEPKMKYPTGKKQRWAKDLK